jgi:hypothetical protein
MAGWMGWDELGGQFAGGSPAVGRNADGRLEVFADGPGAQGPELFHVWQMAPNSGWSSIDSLGAPPGEFLDSPAVASNADGRLEAFVRVGLMSSGALWHIWQLTPNGGWSHWDDLGGPVGAHLVEVTANADGRLEAFVVSSVGTLNHIWQTTPNGGWSDWDDLGKPGGIDVISASAARNADGRLQVASIGTDNQVWQIVQTSAGGGWGGWASLGAAPKVGFSVARLGQDADGRLEVFAVGRTLPQVDTVWHNRQIFPGGPWLAWSDLGHPTGTGQLTGVAVGRNVDGRLDIFTSELNGRAWHIAQTAPGGPWGVWADLHGEPATTPAVAQNADGRLEIFTEALTPNDHPLWHTWQLLGRVSGMLEKRGVAPAARRY